MLAGISRRVYAISGGLARQASERKETAIRVAQFSEFGGPEKLRIDEVPDPTPTEGEIVIRVAAVGLNFFDTLQLRNRYQVTPTLPHSPGGEVAVPIPDEVSDEAAAGIPVTYAALDVEPADFAETLPPK